MLGNFDELCDQGFNAEEILQQYTKTTNKAADYHKELQAKEASKDKQQLSLIRHMTQLKSEK